MRNLHDCPSAEEVSWFAIRQPGLIRVLEQRLWAADGDAFAAALELSCRVVGEAGVTDGIPLPRLDRRLLHAGLARMMDGCDPELDQWIRDQLAELPVMLTHHEEDDVVTMVAAVIWAAAEVRAQPLHSHFAV
jgi:hypothetical protein